MPTYTVLLEDGTTGAICDFDLNGKDITDLFGESITVTLVDENGNLIERTGNLSDVLYEESL